MRKAAEYSHHFGLQVIEEKGLLTEINSLVDFPDLLIEKKAAPVIGKAFERRLSEKSWAIAPEVHADFNLDINAIKNNVGVTMQTGNIARAFYDLMKFQVMYINGRLDAAVLILATPGAASALGSNIANFARVTAELRLYRHIITVPTLIMGFDE